MAGDTWRNITEFRPIRAIISAAKTVGRLITAGIDDIPRALGKISVGKVAETVGKWAGRVLIVPGAVIAGWEDYFQNPGNRSGLDRLGHAFAVGIGTGVGSLAGDAAAVLGCGETGPGAIVCAAVLPTLGAVGGGIVGGAIYDAIEKEINNPAPVTPTFPPFGSPTWPWPSRNWPFQWTF